jgi:hypothetical protein
MELKIINNLRNAFNGNNITESILLSHPYFQYLLNDLKIRYKIDSKRGLILLKYSINSPKNIREVMESRGLILDFKNRFKIAHMGFLRFFNIEETENTSLKIIKNIVNNGRWFEKLDGSCIGIWFKNNQWNISTMGTIDGKAQMNLSINSINFKDFIFKHFGKKIKTLNTNYDYTFEITSQENKIVIDYDKPELKILTIRNNNIELSYDDLHRESIRCGFELPKEFKFNSFDEVTNFIHSKEDFEGLVFVSNNYIDGMNKWRVKYKTPWYYSKHREKNKSKYEIFYDLLMNNKTSDNVPEEYINFLKKVDIIKSVDSFYNEIYTNNKKDFAMKAKQHPFSSYLFYKYNKNKNITFLEWISMNKKKYGIKHTMKSILLS